MNRSQIKLKLGLECFGIDCTMENYQKICDICYLAEKRGVHLYSSPTRVLYDKENKKAFSPMSHESGGNPSWNLMEDIKEIQEDLGVSKKPGFEKYDISKNFYLDDKSVGILKEIRSDMQTKAIEELIDSR